MATDRVEVDTARPFRSVREAVAVFGERILVGDGHSRRPSNGNGNATAAVVDIAIAKHEASSGSDATVSSPDAMEAEPEVEEDAAPAVVPMMYWAPSSPQSSPPPPNDGADADDERDGGVVDEEVTAAMMRSVKRLEAEVAETRQEVAQLKKRGSEMEMAVASLNAQLHRGLSKLAEMEAGDTAAAAAAAARRSIGGETDVSSAVATFRSERWGGVVGDRAAVSRATSCEYLPSFSHALSLGEVDDGELVGRRRKARKVKPIVPLIGDIIFSKRKSTKDKGDDGFYGNNGDLYSVLG
uniref:Uncharacterized protein n=2 Tax=Oryza glaberrima TaxID=4538 RepID=I1QYD3_ORYGL